MRENDFGLGGLEFGWCSNLRLLLGLGRGEQHGELVQLFTLGLTFQNFYS
jgi:hypothetical protein